MPIVGAAITVALLAGGCGWFEDEHAVVVETDPAPNDEAGLSDATRRDYAGAASFSRDDEASERITPDGITLSITAEYHEATRIGGWEAPDHCSFSTTAIMIVQGFPVHSNGFNGPSSDEDGVEGVLGTFVASEFFAPTVEPDATGSTTTSPPTTIVSSDADALILAVAAFGHDGVATLQFAGGPLLDSPWAALDAQPLDGWTPLALAVPRGYVADRGIPDLQFDVTSVDGEPVSSQVLATDQPILEVFTEDWMFDFEAVGPECEPPVGAADNQLVQDPDHILGGAVFDKPTLPAAGNEQPADPTAATEQALTAIRTVYDLSDPFNEDREEAKAQFLEDPEVALEVIRAVVANRVVEPYLSALEPVFDSLVFLSATEAAVSYQVGPSYHWEIGRVLLIDGQWRVALGTVCRDLRDAAFTCEDVAIDPGPGPLG